MKNMKPEERKKNHFLYQSAIFARREAHLVTTILGSCVSVCLWDPVLRVGGINHYLLPLWNGDGLASPKFGNIAIERLIKKMVDIGCGKKNLKSKIFGGASVITNAKGLINIGERNISLAEDMLREEKIAIISKDVGGSLGRKIIFDTGSGSVLVKKIGQLKGIQNHP